MKQENLSGKDGFDLGFGGLLDGFGGMINESQEDLDDRKIGRFGKDGDDLVIDTAYTPDTGFFETGIVDKRYREDKGWIIVDEYKDKKEGKRGHLKWVKALTSKNPPKVIKDVHEDEEYKIEIVKD